MEQLEDARKVPATHAEAQTLQLSLCNNRPIVIDLTLVVWYGPQASYTKVDAAPPVFEVRVVRVTEVAVAVKARATYVHDMGGMPTFAAEHNEYTYTHAVRVPRAGPEAGEPLSTLRINALEGSAPSLRVRAITRKVYVLGTQKPNAVRPW